MVFSSAINNGPDIFEVPLEMVNGFMSRGDRVSEYFIPSPSHTQTD